LFDAEVNASNIIQNGRVEQNNILQKAESEKKNILAAAETEAVKVKEMANEKLQNAEKEGFSMGQKEIEKNLSSILKSLSLKAFDGKLSPEINNEFIQKVFSR
jgi:vacuolar-type H+-ATPase subunit E/Vma4